MIRETAFLSFIEGDCTSPFGLEALPYERNGIQESLQVKEKKAKAVEISTSRHILYRILTGSFVVMTEPSCFIFLSSPLFSLADSWIVA